MALACIKQEGITKEEASDLSQGLFDNVTDKVKCFAKCFLKGLGFLANGKVQPDVLKEILGDMTKSDFVKAVQAKCDSIEGSDECDTGFQVLKCYHEGLI